MVDRQQVLSKLKPMVGNNRQWEAFSNYIDLVIAQHQKVLEQSDDTIMMHRQQGALTALRKLKYLRDEVNGNG